MDTFVSIATIVIGLIIFFVLISKVNKVIRLLSQILNNIREIREPGSANRT